MPSSPPLPITALPQCLLSCTAPFPLLAPAPALSGLRRLLFGTFRPNRVERASIRPCLTEWRPSVQSYLTERKASVRSGGTEWPLFGQTGPNRGPLFGPVWPTMPKEGAGGRRGPMYRNEKG